MKRILLLAVSLVVCGCFTTWLCSLAPGNHADTRKLDSRWQNHGKTTRTGNDRLKVSAVSLQWEKPVSSLIAKAMLHTGAMAMGAGTLVFVAALTLGYAWTIVPHPLFRSALDATLGILSSIPSLIVLLLLISVFGGWILRAIDSPLWGMPVKLAMGATLWALPTGCTFTHLWIGSLQRFLTLPCRQTALAQGVSPHRLYWHHAAWFALRENAQSLYQTFLAFLMGGVVIETFLDIPGLGMLTWQSWQYRDYPLVMGLALFFCVLYWGIDRGRDPWLPTAS
jgi:peptide/nickel transport system permease protein